MIKTTIQFNCTWSKAHVQKLFDKLINAAGITELGLSMISVQDEPTPTEESEQTVHIQEPKSIKTEPLKPIDVPWPTKEESHEEELNEQVESHPYIFTEIERIQVADLGPVIKTSKPILTYAETKDGRVAIYYNESPMYTTLDTVHALPDKIPVDMIELLPAGKRAALRGFKKYLTGIKTSENEKPDNTKSNNQGINPYAPILTGGAKVDTHSSGKVEGDLE